MTRTAHTLRLVLGDQLNPGHSWFQTADPDVVHVFMEVRQGTDYVLHHAQKILAIFAAMCDFARHLRAAGHRVRYVALDNPSNKQSITEIHQPHGSWQSSCPAESAGWRSCLCVVNAVMAECTIVDRRPKSTIAFVDHEAKYC